MTVLEIQRQSLPFQPPKQRPVADADVRAGVDNDIQGIYIDMDGHIRPNLIVLCRDGHGVFEQHVRSGGVGGGERSADGDVWNRDDRLVQGCGEGAVGACGSDADLQHRIHGKLRQKLKCEKWRFATNLNV